MIGLGADAVAPNWPPSPTVTQRRDVVAMDLQRVLITGSSHASAVGFRARIQRWSLGIGVPVRRRGPGGEATSNEQ
jgi:hypothetical protein